MCSLQFGYSVICLVPSGFGSVIELLLAGHNHGSECHWQDAFVAKAERSLPKPKLFLEETLAALEGFRIHLLKTNGSIW